MTRTRWEPQLGGGSDSMVLIFEEEDDNMNSAVSTESMDMGDEVHHFLSQTQVS